MFDSRVILWGVKGLKKKNREILLHVRPYLGMPLKMSNYFHSFPIGQCRWVPCRESFLFSLVNPHGLGPIKIAEIKSRENAIFCNNNCGPTFGGWYNLQISRNANETNSNYSNLSRSVNFLSDTDLPLTGSKYFSVTDYEVFGTWNFQTLGSNMAYIDIFSV